jgi:hypothetical protein
LDDQNPSRWVPFRLSITAGRCPADRKTGCRAMPSELDRAAARCTSPRAYTTPTTSNLRPTRFEGVAPPPQTQPKNPPKPDPRRSAPTWPDSIVLPGRIASFWTAGYVVLRTVTRVGEFSLVRCGSFASSFRVQLWPWSSGFFAMTNSFTLSAYPRRTNTRRADPQVGVTVIASHRHMHGSARAPVDPIAGLEFQDGPSPGKP